MSICDSWFDVKFAAVWIKSPVAENIPERNPLLLLLKLSAVVERVDVVFKSVALRFWDAKFKFFILIISDWISSHDVKFCGSLCNGILISSSLTLILIVWSVLNNLSRVDAKLMNLSPIDEGLEVVIVFEAVLYKVLNYFIG